MTDIRFDLVGFDLDGTLLDTSGDLGAALNHALALAGREPVAMDEVRGLIGGGARVMLERAMALTGGMISNDDIKELHRELLTFYEANIAHHSVLFPGGEAMLAALEERGVTLAVVTNKLERFAVKLLDELGLSPRFAAIIGGDTLGPGKAKPAPDLLHDMLRRTGASSAAYVGDTTFDTRAAQAAGLPCVAVSFGFNDLPPHQLGAAAVIDHYDELVPVLASL